MKTRAENKIIAAGGEVRLFATVMNIVTSLFLAKPTDDDSQEYIYGINELLGTIGPRIEEREGFIARVSRHGIAAVFDKDCEAALSCAVSICQEANLASGSTQCFDGLSVGISCGGVSLSTVEYGEFRTPFLISRCGRVAEYLSSVAGKYNAHILMTGSAAARINSFSGRYSSKRLGMGCAKDGSGEEIIYDVYDGDITDIKYSKRRSKLFFETGVDLFLNGNYTQARTHFIELLKFDRNDSAAKQYVFCCDNCIAGNADELSGKYIELW